MTEQSDEMQNAVSENEQIAERKNKLRQWRLEEQAYPNDFRRDTLAQTVLTQWQDATEEVLEKAHHTVHLAGRIMTRRLMGKASFVHLQDMSGKIQCYVTQNIVGEETYQAFKKWDIGDIVGVVGEVFKTKTGELSLRVSHIRLLTKSLRPLPDKFHGLQEIETRYRQRYLDLIMSENTRRVFAIRSQTISVMRDFLCEKGFLEVETPMMHVLAGGAAAKPFVTHHNALDMQLYLRIAPELYLKRLVVGGIEKVFEINRNFRNEGVSVRHNPEFTMIEFYQAYADYKDMMDLTEELFQTITRKVLGQTGFEYQGHHFDFSKPFARLTMTDAIIQYHPTLTAKTIHDAAALRQTLDMLKLPYKNSDSVSKLQLILFEETVEEKLIDPTFITSYPAEVSPLARRNVADPSIVDRFELFIAGREIANAFSELNDPEDQAARFHLQMQEKAGGDEEAMPYDEDYITALEYGLPPTAGEGIGIDRLVMLLTDSPSIRDVILFPHMRPKG
ncbi:MAG: lysine--tRNA ligase [Gammaproteobacteria bacterium]|nr:lysine--tRNA ligase [Gammaproteobacteria bacterium]